MTVTRCLAPLAVALLLAVGVAAAPEEQNAAAQEQPQQQVASRAVSWEDSLFGAGGAAVLTAGASTSGLAPAHASAC